MDLTCTPLSISANLAFELIIESGPYYSGNDHAELYFLNTNRRFYDEADIGVFKSERN